MNNKFNENELFCKKCLIHDHFFSGGGSWAPDSCPKCHGTDCITWKNINFIKRHKAARLFSKMWEQEHGVKHHFSDPKDHPQYVDPKVKSKFNIEDHIIIYQNRHKIRILEALEKL